MDKKIFDSGMKELDEHIKKLKKIKSSIIKISSINKNSFIVISEKKNKFE